MAEVAVTAALPGSALDHLTKDHLVRVRPGREPLAEAALAEFIGGADAAITLLADPVSAAVLDACARLRVVANYAVGHDNVDKEAAAARGVWVTNTPDVLTDATADLTWALILAVTRRVVEADGYLRAGRFHGWSPELLLGAGLSGRTLGILGYGRIGRAVAVRASAFGMRVVYSEPHQPAAVSPHADYLPLDELLPQSHVLSVHCPLTPETHHLLDAERLAQLPRGAFVVNTARGPIVDEAALVDALERGILAGAGLDVYENEPVVHPGLVRLHQVVLLPHLGSATLEARSAMAGLAVANVAAVLAGREPPAPVVRGR